VALAKHAYRHYDDADSLAVKAIWALGKLRTLEAIEFLGRLQHSKESEIVRSNAKAQLERIESGAPSEDLREAARAAMRSPPAQGGQE
jgi:hypothetical protein